MRRANLTFGDRVHCPFLPQERAVNAITESQVSSAHAAE